MEKPLQSMFGCRGFRVRCSERGRLRHRREDRCEHLRAGRQEGLGRRSKSAPRAGGRRQERQSKSALRTGRGRTGGAKACPGRAGACRTSKAKARPGPFYAADQPQGVSAAASPRRRRRTRRSGTPRGPAPSGRGSRRRWPRCRVRPAGRRFGRRFRPDCAAAAARRPAA